MEIKMDL